MARVGMVPYRGARHNTSRRAARTVRPTTHRAMIEASRAPAAIMPPLRQLVLLSALALLFACAGRQRAPEPAAEATVAPYTVLIEGNAVAFELSDAHALFVDPTTGAELGVDDVLSLRPAARVVYVGEEHDQAAHHEAQLRIARALADLGPSGVGFEMVDWRYQHVLDAYVAGDLPARRLFDELAWDDNWGMDPAMYAELFFTVDRGDVRLLALNAPRTLSRRVYAVGLDGLDAEEREQLPAEYDLTQGDYRAFLAEALAAHMDAEADGFDAMLDRFEQAQLTWDETMASRLADALRAEPSRRWVVVVGAGHVQHRWGVPSRVTRRIDVADLTVVCAALDPADPEQGQRLFDDPPADVLCLSLRAPPEAGGTTP